MSERLAAAAWDTQWDMLCALIVVTAALAILSLAHDWAPRRLPLNERAHEHVTAATSGGMES